MQFQCFASLFLSVSLDVGNVFDASFIHRVKLTVKKDAKRDDVNTHLKAQLGAFIKMTKSELIQKLAERNPHLFLRDIEKIVDTVFDEVSEALVDGDRVELRGFGAFSIKHREARTGRNPRTGETVEVDAKRLPFFKTGKALRERLNDKSDNRSAAAADETKEDTKEDDGFYRPFAD